jgi:hypothetical protein
MKHIAIFFLLAACGTVPTQSTQQTGQPETRLQAPQGSAPTVEAAAAAVAPPPVPWQNWPGNGVVRCHYSDPNVVTADLSVTIEGDTHTSALHVTDAATGLSGDSAASYRPVASPTSLEIVTGTSVTFTMGGQENLVWVVGLNIDTMTMDLACGGQYAATHGLCAFPNGYPQTGCTYTAAP